MASVFRIGQMHREYCYRISNRNRHNLSHYGGYLSESVNTRTKRLSSTSLSSVERPLLLHPCNVSKAYIHINSQSIAKAGNLSISEPVLDALMTKKPVVALESTIISHGMPYPRNVEVARMVEDVVRKHGAVPATIAIIDGVPKVGLTDSEIVKLADSSRDVMKASRRDIAYAIANQRTAATTVASTMILAHQAGIKIFATGGIGGVHRGAEKTFDISADLVELGRTPVTVVCAGVKSILDIPKTLEYLETQGVPVLGYLTKSFPAFFTNDSGIESPLCVPDASIVASMILNAEVLNISHGMVVGVPNPTPADGSLIQQAIDGALKDAESKGIKGNAATPFLLAAIERISGGKSLDANIALVMNNARVAAEIATEYSKLKNSQSIVVPREYNMIDNKIVSTAPKESSEISKIHDKSKNDRDSTSPNAVNNIDNSDAKKSNSPISSRIICVGGAVVDMIGTISSKLILNSSNPGTMRMSYGGVVYNISQYLAKNQDIRHSVELISAIGLDNHGEALLHHAKAIGIQTSSLELISKEIHDKSVQAVPISSFNPVAAIYNAWNTSAIRPRHNTATYTAIHGPDGDLHVAVADMSIFHQITSEQIANMASRIRLTDLVVVDGNISAAAFAKIVSICQSYLIPVFYEPTSDHKCTLPIQAKALHQIDVMKPNVSELIVMIQACLEQNMIMRNKANIQNILKQMIASQKRRLDSLSTSKDPSKGALFSRDDIDNIRFLASGLLHVMFDPSHPSHIFYKSNNANQKYTDNQLTSEGRIRRIHGKHILVSMGSQGILWCGSKYVLQRDPDIQSQEKSNGLSPLTVIDDEVACIHIPAVNIPAEQLLHTSGAGDMFCGGLISHLFSSPRSIGPSAKSIHNGLLAAKNHLIRSID